jgi:nucleoside-diphosphate-sugar epimerase
MIVGNGMISNKFKLYSNLLEDVIIFASGVSDSNENNPENFIREKELLLKTIEENKDKKIIYFSSVLVNFSEKAYYKHKLEMEKIIESNSISYIIYRLPQIVGGDGNKNNIVNYIKNSIIKQNPISIYVDAERALLDVDDLIQFILFSFNLINNEVVILSQIEKIFVTELYDMISYQLKTHTFVTYVSDTFGLDNWDLDNSKIVDKWLVGVDTYGYTANIIQKYIDGNTNWIL